MADDDRLTKLEMLAAHQERQILDLSDMIELQRREIDLLSRRLEKTQSKLLDMAAAEPREGEDAALTVSEQALRDKPPHY